MSITRFEDIDAWKAARVLADKVASVTSARLFHRHPDLRTQMRRAASSVMANIAEGFNSGTDAEFARFLRIALRSATELQSHLYCALDRSLLTSSQLDLVYGVAEDVKNLIGGFVKYLNTRKRLAHFSAHGTKDYGLRTKDFCLMRTALSSLTLLQPRTVAEALVMLRDDGPLVPIAGCTDVYVGLNFGTVSIAPATRFLDLWSLDELREIRVSDDALSIGALATYTDMIRSPLVRERLPILAAASREIGGVQIQNRGTLGGNVANGSPAGDTLPVLAAAEATLLLASAAETRRVPFLSFYTGYRKSVLRPDELLVAIEIPPVAGRQWFRKVGTRAAQAISKVVMAAVRSDRPRVALGSVAPTVVRLPRTEAALAAGAVIEEARRVLETEIQPIDDLRSTAAYRRRISANLLEQFWRETSP